MQIQDNLGKVRKTKEGSEESRQGTEDQDRVREIRMRRRGSEESEQRARSKMRRPEERRSDQMDQDV